MEIGPGKRFCATFFARYYFYARAYSMQRRGYCGAHGRLRVINLYEQTVDEWLYLFVFVWSPRSEN